jgi:YbgC/YbaW family acyl-CoA thioester hydrolase
VVEQVEQARVAWVDTDAGGRIHFTAAFKWAEMAETSLMRRLGVLGSGEWGDYPRRKVEAEYLKVLRFEDEIEVKLRVDKVGRTSVTYAWTISKDGEAYIKGRHTVVHVDAEGRPVPLADGLRTLLDR